MIWNWLHRHPFLVDVALVVLVAIPTATVAAERPHPVRTTLLVVAGTLPLLARRRFPLPVVAIVTAFAIGLIGSVGLGPLVLLPFQLGIALYSLSSSDARRLTRALGLLAVVAAALALAATGHYADFDGGAARVVFLAAAWLLGDSVRSRRAYVREIEAKAERLEQERDAEARRMVTEEQSRIARELHDVLAHALSVIVVQSGAAQELFELEPERAGKPLAAIDAAARSALSDLRRVLGLLQPDVAYAPQPGLSRLDSLIDQVRATGLEVTLQIRGRAEQLPAPVDLSAYRIIQEALTNTLKHAEAGSARVSVRYGDELELEIRDDGHGDAGAGSAGHGVTGMRERVTMLGGTVEIGSAPTGGYRVAARIPVR